MTDQETAAGADEERDNRRVESDGIVATYTETATERVLTFEATADSVGHGTATLAQNRDGYAMVKVRSTVDGDELERYYGFDMALDHAADVLGVSPHDLPIPESAADMGM
ncbi:DUF7111 family protein [Natrarchaeobaculum aegyptiacum]|uniref:Uncharacterized protein n=1 Tax=Natrarchaeobaculum aegyptiacum TaxID=745377 RepID=A0A2Z2HUF4_9EURY|nr:hypothetical protein [Natrarchaeobaculum aegyptiacum]ARS90916.1 hypothetical protein B1756_15055 [Natrarchaeobaculum aegyptiacum]